MIIRFKCRQSDSMGMESVMGAVSGQHTSPVQGAHPVMGVHGCTG